MKSTEATSIPLDLMEAIYQGIPFVRKALEMDNSERDYFIRSSRVLEVEPGEIIIRRGEFDDWVYFLMVGQLLVFPEYNESMRQLVSYISPGEMFGELSFIRELDRNATIIASKNSIKLAILGINISDFGAVDDFRKVAITTKIAFFESAVKTIRKRLELLKIEFPENELALKTPTYRGFEGEKNSLRELLYLQDQSKVNARYLHKWNRSLETKSNYDSSIEVITTEKIIPLLK